MAYVFAALVGLGTLVFAVLQAFRRLKTSRERIENAVQRKDQQVERIRRAGRVCLQLTRDRNAARRRKTALELACQEVEERLKSVGALDRRVYVLDDRRTQQDREWLVIIANPDYAGRINANLEKMALDTWKDGRRFLVYALDQAKAREKAVARYPASKGFAIKGVDPYER